MAPHDADPGSLVGTFRQWVHEDLRESVVELYESVDQPGEVAGRVWLRCERARDLLALLGLDDDRVRRAADLLAPIHNAHVAVDALDGLDVDDRHLRASLEERAAALDALLAPGCATPEAAASLLADADAEIDRQLDALAARRRLEEEGRALAVLEDAMAAEADMATATTVDAVRRRLDELADLIGHGEQTSSEGVRRRWATPHAFRRVADRLSSSASPGSPPTPPASAPPTPVP